MLSVVGLLLVLGTAVAQVLHARQLGVELLPDRFVLHGAVRTEIPADRVHAHRAQIIDLDRRPSFEVAGPLHAGGPTRYRSGWMVLRNGMVVLALLGQGRKWVIMPTSDQFYLAIDPQDFEAFRDGLAAWKQGRRQDTL